MKHLPNAHLVAVFSSTELGVLPLVRAALEEAGIEHMVSDRGLNSAIVGTRTVMSVGETEEPLQVLVRVEDRERAEEVLQPFLDAKPDVDEDGPTR